MASSLDLTRQYSSFAGVDIKCVLGGEIIGQMQAISYAVQREKAPIYVMGRVDPLSFSRGKRGIAGTMISLLLDQHLIQSHKGFSESQFIADKDEIFPKVEDDLGLRAASAFSADDLNPLADPPQVPAEDMAANFMPATPWYVDQILPFDVTIVAANEYGAASAMRIYGCEILNEGSGFSIDDIVIENQMTYVCRTILPWKKLGHWKVDGATGAFNGGFANGPIDADAIAE